MTLNESLSPENQSKPQLRYWRSLSELRESDDFNQYVDREFPVAASEFPEGVSRRRWMQLMGASLTLAGVTGCRYPEEQIAPFVVRPEGRLPGESYVRAMTFEWADRVYNLLISCVDGRPLKIEPNTDHPSGSGTDVYSQASILGLYDPDRARGDDGFLLRKGAKRRHEVDWEEFEPVGKALIKTADGHDKGAALAILTPPTSSPSIVRLLSQVKKRLPNVTIARHDGVRGDAMDKATTDVFGKPARQVLNLADAKLIVAIQSDFLGSDPGQINNARGFAEHRDPIVRDENGDVVIDEHGEPAVGDMSRLYVVEGGYTITGAMADSRLALRPSEMPAFLSELGRRVEALQAGEQHEHDEQELPYDHEDITPAERLERFLDVLAQDLAAAGADAVVIVGDHLGAEAVAAGIRMNKKLGSLGKLQSFQPLVDNELEAVSLADLTGRISTGDVDTLVILGGNPVIGAPGEIDFAAAIGKVDKSVYLGDYDDETGSICTWSLPLAHPLESWGDAINAHGYYGVCQPHILPLLGGRSVVEVLANMLDEDVTDGQRIVRKTADEVRRQSLSEREWRQLWRQLLHDGFSDDVKADTGELNPSGDYKELTSAAPVAITAEDVDQDNMEVIFVPADGIYDGRFANNGWLQELPHALTKMCWDNAAVMSPGTAKKLGIKHGLKVALRRDDNSVELPVYEMPGCAPGVVTVVFGYGRTKAGKVGGDAAGDVDVIGVDVTPIRSSDAMLVAYQVEGRPNYNEYELSTTQDHWAIDERGRDETESRSFSLIREGTVDLLKKVPEFADGYPKEPHVPHVGETGSPWKEPMDTIEADPKNEHVPQWGMSIDLTKCTGCNACVIACQSENNVPIVGREQVMNSREMHWLRIDRYFQGDEENADIVQQPMACQHCETAPCEQVCPVAATVHTDEGLNAMAYNRCIGTRYCANNCPFKVRRFNYFNYNGDVGTGYGVDSFPGAIESANRKLQALVLNPEVTTRGRGVMEKCTYCVQRIEGAKITARKEDRSVQDGDVVTACQSACSTRAIEFGNIADPTSVVSQKRADVRSYGMLNQLNVKARTEYLARVRNPHKRLMTAMQLRDLEIAKGPHKAHHDDHKPHDDDKPHDDHGKDEQKEERKSEEKHTADA